MNISKSASEAASKVFASMDIKWPTFADKQNVEQVLQEYIDTARQKDAETIAELKEQLRVEQINAYRLGQTVVRLQNDSTSLTKQVEELKADKEVLDWLESNHIDFAEELHRIGWKAPNDAQWEKLKLLLRRIRFAVRAAIDQANYSTPPSLTREG